MATIAITYGGGNVGIHVCSFTVKPATTARPETSAGAQSVERQEAHTGPGGCRSCPHSVQRWKRSLPSVPDVQMTESSCG